MFSSAFTYPTFNDQQLPFTMQLNMDALEDQFFKPMPKLQPGFSSEDQEKFKAKPD